MQQQQKKKPNSSGLNKSPHPKKKNERKNNFRLKNDFKIYEFGHILLALRCPNPIAEKTTVDIQERQSNSQTTEEAL